MSVYAASDWHGCYWVWEKVKEILKPEDKLYFLGDAADRGHDGWRMIKELLSDPRIIYIKGNHEDLLVKAIGNYTPREDKEDYFWDKNMEVWFWNGAEPTYNAFCDDPNKEEKVKILKQIKTLPFCANYVNTQGLNIFMCHAGCEGDDIDSLSEYDAIWDRNHWLFPETWYGDDNTIIVHGHTPISLMIKEQEFYVRRIGKKGKYISMPKYNIGTYWYGRGHKVCIDTGTFWDNIAILFNLDTYKEIFITKE